MSGFFCTKPNISPLKTALPAIKAAFRNFDERIEKIKTLRNSLKEGLENEVNDIRINTPLDISIPSILNVTFMDVRAEVLLHTLEQDGIYVSTGSACSSNKKGESHVLKAMGLKNADIEGTIRWRQLLA